MINIKSPPPKKLGVLEDKRFSDGECTVESALINLFHQLFFFFFVRWRHLTLHITCWVIDFFFFFHQEQNTGM